MGKLKDIIKTAVRKHKAAKEFPKATQEASKEAKKKFKSARDNARRKDFEEMKELEKKGLDAYEREAVGPSYHEEFDSEVNSKETDKRKRVRDFPGHLKREQDERDFDKYGRTRSGHELGLDDDSIPF